MADTKPLVERLVSRMAPGFEKPGNEAARARVGALEGWVSVVVNTVLAVAKAVLAVLSGSLSLLADAVHTFADSLTSVVVIVGFRLSTKPADREHPFGHARIESVATLIIGVLLAVAAFELGRAAVERLLHPTALFAPTWIIVTVALTALAKEGLARFSFQLGRLIQSDALVADGWHHRSDVFATGLVTVSFVAARFGLDWLDGVAGVGVAVIIAWTAAGVIRQAAAPLIGERASREAVARVAEIAGAVEGVVEVHDIVMQYFGRRVVVSLHVVVPGTLSSAETHRTCEAVESRLASELGAHATVHADPQGLPHPEEPAILGMVNRRIEAMEGCAGIHDLRVEETGEGRLAVSFDVSTTRELASDVIRAAKGELESCVREKYHDAEISIEFDPPFCLPTPSDRSEP